MTGTLYGLFQTDGYPVWFNVGGMSGTLSDQVAEGIENSGIVLLCLSEYYQRCGNCERGNILLSILRNKNILFKC